MLQMGWRNRRLRRAHIYSTSLRGTKWKLECFKWDGETEDFGGLTYTRQVYEAQSGNWNASNGMAKPKTSEGSHILDKFTRHKVEIGMLQMGWRNRRLRRAHIYSTSLRG